jgi:hypothetical protein
MSSSVAMNRRISRNAGEVNEFQMQGNSMGMGENRNRLLNGTPLQKQYQILNFHETRLNEVYKQVHILTAKLDKLEPDTNLRLNRLEQENAALRRHIMSLQKSTENNNNSNINVEVNED